MLARILFSLLLCGMLGCGGNPPAQEEYPTAQFQYDTYTVNRGDTLYSIAFRAGMDYRKVAAANRIVEPYTIYPGQIIRLNEAIQPAPIAVMPPTYESPPSLPPTPTVVPAPSPISAHGSSTTAYPTRPRPIMQGAAVTEPPIAAADRPTVSAPIPVPIPAPVPTPIPAPMPTSTSTLTSTSTPVPTSPPMPTSPPTPTPTSIPVPTADVARTEVKKQVEADTYTGDEVKIWLWPAAGPVTRSYSESVHKGIDIGGARGEPVVAVAAGKVVYSGTGIVGFGELLIIKHNEVYLSAYGHNDRLLVTEGQTVKAGQVIAEKGSSGTDTVKLHFEIRKEGKPIDPQRVLPGR